MDGGHGHVVPRADGAKARCGGPAICGECARELALMNEALDREVGMHSTEPVPVELPQAGVTPRSQRRLGALYFTPELMATLSSSTVRIEANRLPDDAEVVGAYFSETRQAFAVVVCSASYEPVELGQEIPALESPRFIRIDG
jgi:hypothetical protein